MPRDIDQVDNKYNIRVLPSKTVELIAAVHLIADKRHHELLPDWSKYVIEHLSPKGSATLELISSMNFPGLELYDFVTNNAVFDDIELLLNKILEYSELDYAFIALNEELDREQIKTARSNPQEFHNIIEGLSWSASGTERALKAIVYDTENYKRSIVELAREVYALGFEEQLALIQERYQEAMDNIYLRLEGGKNPIELAEEIKGYKVSSRKSYKEYIFTPSYFLHTHNIISYGSDKFMLAFNINVNNMEISAEAERIADLLKVLSEKSRLEILRQLRRRTTYGKVLASRLNLTTATISRHLEQLRGINLIKEEKKDNVKYFKVNHEEIDKLLEDIKNFING